MIERNVFLANPNHQYHVSQCKEHDYSANNKNNGDYYIQFCRISWMNINYKENGGKKAFLANPKHQYCVSQYGQHDCSALNKRNGDYYEYPSLPHFTDKHYL